MIRIISTIAAVATYLLGSVASYAASCPGVELRVNSRTTELQTDILALIQQHKITMKLTETKQRAEILSALNIATKQAATSGNQDAAVRLKAEEANAQAVVAAQNRQAVVDALERYGDAGYSACGIVAKSQAVATAYANEENRMNVIEEKIVHKPNSLQDGASTDEWLKLVSDGSGTSAASIFSDSSTPAEVAKYIDWLMGPPQSSQGGSAGAISNVDRIQRDAQRSVAQYLLIKAAVSSEDGSVDHAISELTSTWVGTQGGAAWAAKLATSPLRAVLLDMSRAEAANLVAQVRELDHQLDLELGVASFSLARSTKMANGQ